MMAQVIRGVAGVRARLGFLKTTTYAYAYTYTYTYTYTYYATPLQQQRRLAHRAALKLPGQLKVEKKEEEEEEKRRSRNDLKKQAHQTVRWGMELASFSVPQIKRILLVASLDKQVFEALLLVKKLGPDVREGKRRQFNYIGKLLRDAQPDLLSALIQATKDGDHSRFHSLADSVQFVPQQELYDSGPDLEPPQDSGDHLSLATSWFDGFMNKDIQISNEVYSINSVEFDRQELRRLVRNVQYIQDCRKGDDQDSEETAALAAATNSLRCFLISLARRLSISSKLSV